MSKFGIFIVLLIGAFIWLKMSTDDEEAARQKIIQTTSNPVELVSAILNDKHDEAKPTVDVAGDRMTVTYGVGSGKSDTTLDLYKIHVEMIVPKVFNKFSSVNFIELIGTGHLVDLRGHKSVEPVARAKFSRSNAATVNWENVSYKNVPKIADQFWVHPAMLRDE